MPLLELTLLSTFQGERMINRFNYVGSGTPAAVSMSFALGSAFGAIYTTTVPVDSVFDRIQAITSTEVTFDSVLIKNIYSVTDFFENAFPAATTGDGTGDTASPIIAYGFRTSRVRSDIRRGFKRIGGVPQGAYTSGGVLQAPYLAAAQALATEMANVIEYDDSGNTLSFVPCILGREKYTTPSGKDGYRYYPTEVEQLAYVADGFVWELYDTVRGQGSRQYGKGV